MVFLPVLLSIIVPKAYLDTEAEEAAKDVANSNNSFPKQNGGEVVTSSKIQPDESSNSMETK